MRSTLPLFLSAFVISAPVLATENVPVPAFRSVELSGGGEVVVVPGPTQRVTILEGSSQFTSMQVLRGGKLRILTCNNNCPHRYRLRIEVQDPNVPDLAINGGGLISVRNGFRPQSQISVAINGGGKIDTLAVDAGTASAAVHGGGELLVRARGMLSAAINGGGVIRYAGNPQISTAIAGGGVVSRIR
jgi:hypothetical protein